MGLEKQRRLDRQRNKRQYRERKKAGLCSACGKRPPSRRALCRPCIRRRQAYYQSNKAQRAAYSRSYLLALKKAAFLAYGGDRCSCCAEHRKEFLTIDHINGGGNKHRKRIGGAGAPFYRWLKKRNYPVGFRVLCMNCNFAIGVYGYCPHQRSVPGDSLDNREVTLLTGPG